MAVKTQVKSRTLKTQKKRQLFDFPLERTNIIFIGIGIGFIILGYIFMSQNSVDGFLPTIVAPILLVLGYCVFIPYGILKRTNEVIEEKETVTARTTEERQPVMTETKAEEKKQSGQSSNIKTKNK